MCATVFEKIFLNFSLIEYKHFQVKLRNNWKNIYLLFLPQGDKFIFQTLWDICNHGCIFAFPLLHFFHAQHSIFEMLRFVEVSISRSNHSQFVLTNYTHFYNDFNYENFLCVVHYKDVRKEKYVVLELRNTIEIEMCESPTEKTLCLYLSVCTPN